jgi:hypothetical protein
METPPLTVGSLIEALDDLPHDTPLRLAAGRNWPSEYTIGDPVVVAANGVIAVYLPEQHQIGYLPSQAAVALRWADEDRGMHYPEEER